MSQAAALAAGGGAGRAHRQRQERAGAGTGRAAAAETAVEIVSVDSAQVYRGMDIGTAKPRAARARVPHHLIDIRDPAESYSAGEFVREAHAPWRRSGSEAHCRCSWAARCCICARCATAWPTCRPPRARVRAEIDARRPAPAGARCTPSWRASIRLPQRASLRRMRSASSAHSKFIELPVFRSRIGSATRAHATVHRWLHVCAAGRIARAAAAAAEAALRAMLEAGFVDEVRALYRARRSHAAACLDARGRLPAAVADYSAGGATLAEAATQALTATLQLAKRQLTWLRREREHDRRQRRRL